MESLYIADLLAGKEDRIGKYYYCFDPTILTLATMVGTSESYRRCIARAGPFWLWPFAEGGFLCVELLRPRHPVWPGLLPALVVVALVLGATRALVVEELGFARCC